MENQLKLYETYMVLKLTNHSNNFHPFEKQNSSYELLKLANLSCPILAQLGHGATSINYWQQQGPTLKLLWDVSLCVIFLTKLIALNLKLYRANYTLHKSLQSDMGVETQGKFQKIISHSILIQWPYNLYGWKALDVQFILKQFHQILKVVGRAIYFASTDDMGFSMDSYSVQLLFWFFNQISAQTQSPHIII